MTVISDWARWIQRGQEAGVGIQVATCRDWRKYPAAGLEFSEAGSHLLPRWGNLCRTSHALTKGVTFTYIILFSNGAGVIQLIPIISIYPKMIQRCYRVLLFAQRESTKPQCIKTFCLHTKPKVSDGMLHGTHPKIQTRTWLLWHCTLLWDCRIPKKSRISWGTVYMTIP